MNDIRNWAGISVPAELAMNFVTNRTTSIHLPFFLNYGYLSTAPANLVHRNERTRQALVQQFSKRRRRYWNIPYEQRKQAIVVQSEYYEDRWRSVNFNAGDLVVLSTTHLKMKGVDNKLKRNMLAHFELERKLSHRVMILSYPTNGECIMFSYLLALILKRERVSARDHSRRSCRTPSEWWWYMRGWEVSRRRKWIIEYKSIEEILTL